LDGIVKIIGQCFAPLDVFQRVIGQGIPDRDVKAGTEAGLGFTNKKTLPATESLQYFELSAFSSSFEIDK